MARVTVDDCLQHVENRFDLVLQTAKRAHELALGAADPMVPADNDKPTVIALREIAAGYDVTKEKEPLSLAEKNPPLALAHPSSLFTEKNTDSPEE